MTFLGSRIYRLVKLSIYTGLGLLVAFVPAAANTDRGNMGDFRAAMLKMHNVERTRYGYSNLNWSENLAKDASHWAKSLAQKNRFEHAFSELRKKKQGENLWMGTSAYFSYDAMAQMWLDEKTMVKNGVFPNVTTGKNWSEVGHYTQIIWPETREIGCALALGGANEYLVCRYWPAGNIIGTKMSFRK